MATRWNRRCAALVMLAVCSPARTEEFELARTHAVIVGVLEWKHGLAGYPKKNRKDRELRDLLVRRGTPAANVAMLLDERATLANIRDVVTKAARAAGPGSTLIVYYAGHGLPGDGAYYFANYDVEPGKLAATGWSLKGLGDTLVREFKGKRVILWADCCYSGGLEQVVDRLAGAGIAAVSLTSAGPANVSTNNWTFTQTLIDGLNGGPLVDVNGDGRVTLDDLAGEVREAMRHREGQLHGYKVRGIPGDFVIAAASGPKPKTDGAKWPIGAYVTARDAGQPRVGRVVGMDGDRRVVEFYDYTEKRSTPYTANDLAVSTGDTNRAPVVLDFGSRVEAEVEWQGKWCPANVLRTQKDKTLVHFVGYTDSWNEWIGNDRLRQADCEIEWQGVWYPALVLKTDQAKRLIHYVGFDASWDEWVGRDRIRRPDTKAMP
jgi:hypothetical protein